LAQEVIAMGRERANFGALYAAIFKELAQGRYRPGDRIGLKALSDVLGVSTTPLREALSRLVGRDLVTEQRSEGYYLARLDARDVADLYRLHHACVERAIDCLPTANVSFAPADGDIWCLFDALAVASGDRILTGVRRYLDDRLKLVRRCEGLLLADEPDATKRWQDSMASADATSMRILSKGFHATRIDQADRIAELVNRGRTDQIY
jgi:hypothetical protein